MNQVFDDMPEVLSNTLEIAEKVEHYSINHAALMPFFPIEASFGTEEEYRTRYNEEDLKKEFGLKVFKR